MCGALAGADPGPVGAAVAVTVGAAAGASAGGFVPWTQTIATETVSEAANASQRPRPLANKFLPTDSTLVSCATRVAIFGS
jgi:hypothetical protein